MPTLEKPQIDFMPSYIEALREGFILGGENPKTEAEISEIENDHQAFLDELLRIKTEPLILADGTELARVPYDKFWYMDGNHFIGKVSIRHQLNDHLRQVGGHIGYGVRPSEQGKGHATDILTLALDYCRVELALQKVLLTVSDDNISSIKVIKKCSGILENITKRDYDGVTARRYWVHL